MKLKVIEKSISINNSYRAVIRLYAFESMLIIKLNSCSVFGKEFDCSVGRQFLDDDKDSDASQGGKNPAVSANYRYYNLYIVNGFLCLKIDYIVFDVCDLVHFFASFFL